MNKIEQIAKRTIALLTRLVVPHDTSTTAPGRKVAIVVPISNRTELLPEEEVSMRHLCHFLGKYDKYLIAPAGLRIQRPDFKIVHFPRKFFGSAVAHNHLLMWPQFYRTFEDYEYILIYHLDALVLSDEISQWCETGIDYIGAPWLPNPNTPWVEEPRVGNGGFTLMKVASVLKVLYNRHRTKPATYWKDILLRNSIRLRSFFRLLERLQPFFPHARLINRPLWELQLSHRYNNDYFWSFSAVEYMPEFKVASVEEGLRFAFEAAPRVCFEMNQHRLPFGCHAWTKYDRSFWEPHLLMAGEATARHKADEQANGSTAVPPRPQRIDHRKQA